MKMNKSSIIISAIFIRLGFSTVITVNRFHFYGELAESAYLGARMRQAHGPEQTTAGNVERLLEAVGCGLSRIK